MKPMLIFCSISTLLWSAGCSKPVHLQVNDAMLGTWSLQSLVVQSHSSVYGTEFGYFYQIDTTFNYTSLNNSGIVNIRQNQIFGVGIAYTVSDTLRWQAYADGIPDPRDYGNAAVTYEKKMDYPVDFLSIGNDSLYFPTGWTLTAPDTIAAMQPWFPGAKVSVNGNTLSINAHNDWIVPYSWDTTLNYHLVADMLATFARK